MSNTKLENSLFKQRITSNKSKLLLLAVAAAILAMDAIVAGVAIKSGMGAKHFILPLIFAILDVLLAPVILFSNFRFKHSRLLPWIYSGIIVVLSLIVVLIIGANIFTAAASVLFLMAHVMLAAALMVGMISAAKLGKKNNPLLTFGVMGLFGVLAIAHVISTLSGGFYGQGPATATRSIVFELDEKTDTYTVSRVLKGISDRVMVPAEYKGKPVGAIDGAIFADSSITEVHLERGAEVTFLSNDALRNMTASVYADKEDISALQTAILDAARRDDRLIGLSNSLVPGGLEEDEVYITFAYSAESLRYTDYTPIPTWFGKKGDTFDLGKHAEGLYYAEEYTSDNEDVLYRSYQNGKKILMPLKGGSNEDTINNKAIRQCMDRVKVEFDDVYAIKIGDDNDARYESANSFKEYNNTGYRYVVASDPDNLLGKIAKREGFDLSWAYSSTDGNRVAFTKLSEVLGTADLTVYPVWELKAPEIITAMTNKADNTFIYFEDLILNGNAKTPLAGIELEYEWVYNGNTIALTKQYEQTQIRPNQTGVYTLRVTTVANEITSLTAVSTKDVSVTINKRPVRFTWTLPEIRVYSGTDKTISVTHTASDLVNSDTITYVSSITTVRDATTYYPTVSITGAMAELYCVAPEDVSRELTITPYELTVDWANLSFTYDGSEKKPTASANGVGDDASRKIEILVENGKINANTTQTPSYTATAVSREMNYIIGNKEQAYTIDACEVTLTSWKDTSLTYNRTLQHASVSAVSLEVSTTESASAVMAMLSYEGAQMNAGNNYTVTARMENSNYKIKGTATATYSIAKATLSVAAWPSVTLYYSGQPQGFEATVNGEIEPGDAGITHTYSTGSGNLSGKPTDAGSYTVTLGCNSNYSITASTTFKIRPKNLTVSYANTLTFNNNAQRPTATVSGLVNGEGQSVLNISYSDTSANINAGTSYTVTFSFTNTNYCLNNTDETRSQQLSYSISKAPLTLIWADRTFTYNGEEQTYEAEVNGVMPGDDANITFVYSKNIDLSGKPTNAGTYTVRAVVGNSNYQIVTGGGNQPMYINAKPLNVTWPSNKTLTYNGAAQSFHATVTGVITGDDAGLAYTYTPGGTQAPKDAGDYTVTLSCNSNYSLSSTSTTFTIRAKTLTVSWPSNTKVYSGSTWSFQATVSGTVNSESANVSYTYYRKGSSSQISAPANAGDYTAKIKVGNSNYTVAAGDVSKDFSITKKSLTINWPTTTEKEYAGSAWSFVATSVSGETTSGNANITYWYQPEGGTATQSKPVNAGKYRVTAQCNDNYTITNPTIDITITPKELTISWKAATNQNYTGNPIEFRAITLSAGGATVTETQAGVWYEYKTTAGQSLGTTAPTDVGAYTVTIHTNSNYIVRVNATKTFNII